MKIIHNKSAYPIYIGGHRRDGLKIDPGMTIELSASASNLVLSTGFGIEELLWRLNLISKPSVVISEFR